MGRALFCYLTQVVGIYKARLVYWLAAMLMLLFQIGDERWAIAASEVKAVVPLVDLQPHSQPMIAGLLNYHGEILPAVDVSALIARKAAPQMLSTRAVIVENGQRMALVVERAGETAWLSETVNLPAQNAYSCAVMKNPKGEIVQRLEIAPLFQQVFEPVFETNLQLDGVS
jgi:chemotaxis signal transduction protein